MNKQRKEDKKTAHNGHNILPLLYIHYIYKSSRSVRDQYELNTHAITILVACYLYSCFVNSLFCHSHIRMYLGVYNSEKIKRYLLLLVDKGLLTQSGTKFSMTDTGIQAIEEISQNSESLIYEFCSKYGIEL